MNIVVIGASHGIGLATVKAALAAGHAVHAMARSAAPLANEKLAWFFGDVTSPHAFDEALENAQAAIITLGMGSTLTRKPVTLFTDATQALLAAMQKHGLRRLVCVTGIGAGDSRGHGTFFHDKILLRFGLKTIYADKERQEQMIWGSGLDWTIVRPGFLTDGPSTGKVRVLTTLDGVKARKISRADVGEFLVKCLRDENTNRRTLFIDGG
jgi:uncharacterized protein YbjT (DUF2867 family)